MTDQDRDATLALCLMAAFADGRGEDQERAEVKRIAERLSQGTGVDLAGVYQDVLLGKRDLEATAAELRGADVKQLAYELAVCVCDADGARSGGERDFLEKLRGALGLDAAGAQAFAERADALASIPLGEGARAAPPPSPVQAGAAAPPRVDEAELDRTILDRALLNGALELLPESLATLAIVPLQMKLVYAIGKAYGYELDRGHVKDFLATAGVGLTSQYVEQVGRKLVGGLLRRVGGGLLGGLGRQATSSAFAFASTYALGHLAKRYYAGGRTLSVELLRRTFEELVGEAQSLRERHAGEIEQRARTIDVAQLTELVRRPV